MRRVTDFLIELEHPVVVIVTPRIHAECAQADQLDSGVPHISNLLFPSLTISLTGPFQFTLAVAVLTRGAGTPQLKPYAQLLTVSLE
jgi:hypothetical protein